MGQSPFDNFTSEISCNTFLREITFLYHLHHLSTSGIFYLRRFACKAHHAKFNTDVRYGIVYMVSNSTGSLKRTNLPNALLDWLESITKSIRNFFG